MFLELEPYLNSKYSKYEEDVLIDPFLRPPICLIIISVTAFVAAIIILILYDQVCFKILCFQIEQRVHIWRPLYTEFEYKAGCVFPMVIRHQLY